MEKLQIELQSLAMRIEAQREKIALAGVGKTTTITDFVMARTEFPENKFKQNWVKQLSGKIDSVEILRHAEKDNLIPWDMKLAVMDNVLAQHKNDNITLKDGEKHNDYVILKMKGDKVIIGKAFTGEENVSVINKSKLDQLKKHFSELDLQLESLAVKVLEHDTEMPELTAEPEMVLQTLSGVPIRHKQKNSFQDSIGYFILFAGLFISVYSIIKL